MISLYRIARMAMLALAATAILAFPVPAQQSSAELQCEDGFAVFDAEGNSLTLNALIERASKADAVLLGEDHDDRLGHCLQNRIFRAFYHAISPRPVLLSLEMFERDTQTVLNEYLNGIIDEKLFLAAARPWKNYAEDYRPLVEFAKEKDLPVVAANAPRRYVTVTARKGPSALDALSAQAKSWLPPLPLAPPSAAYRERFSDVMQNLNPAGPCADEEEMARGAEKPDPHKPPADHGHGATPGAAKPTGMPTWDNLIASQSLWDAAMAHTVAEALQRHPGALVVHLNGAFHTERGMGILERLPEYREGTKTFVVGFYPRKSFTQFDDGLTNAANAIIQTSCRDYRKKK